MIIFFKIIKIDLFKNNCICVKKIVIFLNKIRDLEVLNFLDNKNFPIEVAIVENKFLFKILKKNLL
jgi:hypothetical protein